MIFGAPEQFTLMPTTSLGEKKLAQASRSLFVFVSDCIPVDSILRMTASSTRSVSGSMAASECRRVTAPRYGPGIPGLDAGA